MKNILKFAFALILLVSGLAMASSIPVEYGAGTTGIDARYGAVVGASAHWAPAYATSSQVSANIGFGGNVALSCSGIDFQGFLSQFNPNELLTQMKNTLISGAQAAVSSYLIMLAYSNPTLASVLDMMDKKYTAQFGAFAQACNAQQAKKMGREAGATQMAEAQDQCFAQQVQQGTSPTEAYRVCANISTFGSADLPALKDTSDFLKRYTSINVTAEMGALMNMLPDQKIDQTGMKMRPATLTTMQMYTNLETRSRAAISSILGGTDPATIPECKDTDISGTNTATTGCLPSTASNLVNSPTFLSARMLSPASSELYTSAMSSQIATTAMYSNIYELKQQVAAMDVKTDAGAGASEVVRRRDALLKSISSLESEADALRKVQDSRIKMAKTQILTIQKAQDELDSRASEANDHPISDGMSRLLRMFY